MSDSMKHTQDWWWNRYAELAGENGRLFDLSCRMKAENHPAWPDIHDKWVATTEAMEEAYRRATA